MIELVILLFSLSVVYGLSWLLAKVLARLLPVPQWLRPSLPWLLVQTYIVGGLLLLGDLPGAPVAVLKLSLTAVALGLLLGALSLWRARENPGGRLGAFLLAALLPWSVALLVEGVSHLSSSSVASAHSPIFLPDGQTGIRVQERITDPERSWAAYGRLAAGAAADVVPIQAKQGQNLYLQVLVPDRSDLAAYRPQMVLPGPGLRGALPADLPVKPTSGQGALVIENPKEPKRIYEGFTQMNLLEYGTVENTFPESGEYQLVIYNPAGKGGPYTAVVGKAEVVGPIDVLTFPLVWARAHVWLWK